jgi:acetoacetyl-CoA synthetase
MELPMQNILWEPKHTETTNMWKFMRFVEKKHNIALSTYEDLHRWSIQEMSSFWMDLTEFYQIQFDQEPTEILNQNAHMLDTHWFSGAHFNFAEQLLKRKDDHTALISVDESGKRQIITYAQLRASVAACAAGLKALGVQKGDRVGAVLPNLPFAIIAMLATTSLGAIWSSCSPDFGAPAVIDRLGQLEPKVLFISDGHQYQGKTHDASDKILTIINAIPSLAQIVLCPVIGTNPTHPLIQPWDDFIKPNSEISFVSLPFNHPVYILFSSGTTGKPKCIIHGAGGTLLQHIKELGLHTNLTADDNMCFYTTCGWMMWNWMVSTLALGATLTLYEGSPTYPNPDSLFELIYKEKITVFGTSAKFLSAVEKNGVTPIEYLKTSPLRTILSTGSPLLPKNFEYVYQQVKSDVQLSSISGGTDIVSCFALGNPLLPVYRGELQCLGLGMDVHIFDEKGNASIDTLGELVCTSPFPSMPIGFFNDQDKTLYKKAYFSLYPNAWAQGDYAKQTSHGGLIIYGRSDAVLNPGGVRIGTAEIYRQVETIPEVLDSVVISQDYEGDCRIVLFVKLREGALLKEDLCGRICNTLKINASPRHVPSKILQVLDIPRTISGKTVELAVRQTVHGKEVTNLDALANPDSLAYFKNRVELQ